METRGRLTYSRGGLPGAQLNDTLQRIPATKARELRGRVSRNSTCSSPPKNMRTWAFIKRYLCSQWRALPIVLPLAAATGRWHVQSAGQGHRTNSGLQNSAKVSLKRARQVEGWKDFPYVDLRPADIFTFPRAMVQCQAEVDT